VDAYWYDDTYEDQIRLGLKVRAQLYAQKSQFQQIEIIDTLTFGRVLVLDGVYQTSEVDEYRYHEMLVHPAMVSAPAIARVLIIGGGDGGTAREVLRHRGVERAVMAEIDGGVVEACREHMPALGAGAWEDPRLDLQLTDGVAYVKGAAPASFDVIILDGPDPTGPAEGLYAAEFYQDVQRALTPGGVFALHAESPVVVGHLFEKVLTSLAAVFPQVHPYFGSVPLYGTGPWAWCLAGASVDPLALHEDRAPAIERDTRYYNRAIHRAAFVLPNEIARERW
jgi:spermidine synthase